MEKLINVAINDFKLVFRDKSLRIFFVFPVLSVLVVLYGFPYIANLFPIIRPYISILMMSATMQNSLMFGFIYSMVLIDEKDTNVAKVYGVLPVSNFWFVIFRLIAPFLFATFFTIAMLSVEPFYGISFVSNFYYSALAGLVAPLMVLFVATVSRNKLDGMTWQKLFNLPTSLPLLAFFVPASYSFLFAIFPTHWAYQGFKRLISGESFALYLLFGFVYTVFLISLIAKRFSKSHFQ
ncbi:MAG: hypothetical protein HKN25_16165 [Pyrinomonadaceae bacterium]|nr:hypothetical protein [Pyrinomonadaceae bacterium]